MEGHEEGIAQNGFSPDFLGPRGGNCTKWFFTRFIRSTRRELHIMVVRRDPDPALAIQWCLVSW